ncbi:dihydrodipicolinate synthase family protein (plasmid) [Roseomonas gilardii subsp. gilardii]|uniref:dihydrodipicolinate synthase family protein n=1 Tax=Roseomonas gilardii TaxID=257708 RepID=UPI001FFAEB4F|nr:dihydrodipicolinate synthase family protein [Roseomonas gilardii]UPG74741.1 dihydrodipicolinate synthase family protein [Roseomonas gilardii subsp. gilardii]
MSATLDKPIHASAAAFKGPSGVFCAALTPLTAELAPDHATFAEHARWLLEEGCDGIAMLGTTGEANSFSVGERKALLEATIGAGIAPDRLLPGTGVAALTETVELTRHALSLGVTTVVMLPPFYYKNVSDDGVFAAYAEVIERLGDARLRVVLYHIPQMSAVPLSLAVIARLIERFPGTVVGIKDSAGDIGNMLAMVERFPGFSVLAGADPLLLPLRRQGGAGCITATSNLVARDLAFIYRHALDDSRSAEVEAAQERVVTMRNRASRFAQMASLKALTAERSGHTGWMRMRPPLMALSAEEKTSLLGG